MRGVDVPKLEYIQIYADQMEYLAEYDDAQLGRLVRAMMAYAFADAQPDFAPDDAARYIWPVLRRAIDRVEDKRGQISAARSRAAASRWGSRQDNATDANICTRVQMDDATMQTDAKGCEGCNTQKQTQTHTQTQKQRQGQTQADDQTQTQPDERAQKPKPKRGDRGARMIPPTVGDVAAYCAQRGNGIDARQFVDFYTAKGWRVGNAPMKDWQACVRTWEARGGRHPPDGQRPHGAETMQRHAYTPDDYAGMAVDLDAD